MECFTLLLEHFAWIEHSFFEWHHIFKEGGESEEWWEVLEEQVVNTPELIGQSFRAKVTMLRF